MKKFLVFLIPIIFTVLVIVLPDLFFSRRDESYRQWYVREDRLDIQVAEDISVDKMIDVAADDNSRFIEYDYGEYEQAAESELVEIGMDVLDSLEEILSMDMPDKESIIKNCYYNKVNVIGNSEYNSYMFSICEMIFTLEDAEIHILYLPDKDEILSANVFCFNEYGGYFVERAALINKMLGEYYGHDNWSAEIFESEVYVNQGSDREAVHNIIDKMGMLEIADPSEYEIYN